MADTPQPDTLDARKPRHAAYADPLNGGDDGYQAACWDCEWRSQRISDDKSSVKAEARAHADTAGPPPGAMQFADLLDENERLRGELSRLRDALRDREQLMKTMAVDVAFFHGMSHGRTHDFNNCPEEQCKRARRVLAVGVRVAPPHVQERCVLRKT